MPIYKGQTKIVKLYKGSTQIVKRYKGTDLIYSASRLPAEFQEVEYIESSGTQYIDTQFIPSAFSKAVCDIQFTNTNNQLCGVFGSGDGRFQFGMITNQGFYAGIGTLSHYFSKTKDTDRHTFVLDNVNKIVSIDTESYYDNTVYFGSNADKFLLFGRTSGHIFDTEYACSMKHYSSQFYDNDILTRNFVPCYRKADNVAGLYDLVNGVFYTNAGTGTFIVGGNV